MNERFLATAAVALGLGAAFGTGTGGAGDAEAGAPGRSAIEAPPAREASELPVPGVETKQATGPAAEWLPNGLIQRTDFFAVAVAAISARSRSGESSRSTAGPMRPRTEKGGSRGHPATQVEGPPPTPEP
jgi:hypothetical protein